MGQVPGDVGDREAARYSFTIAVRPGARPGTTPGRLNGRVRACRNRCRGHRADAERAASSGNNDPTLMIMMIHVPHTNTPRGVAGSVPAASAEAPDVAGRDRRVQADGTPSTPGVEPLARKGVPCEPHYAPGRAHALAERGEHPSPNVSAPLPAMTPPSRSWTDCDTITLQGIAWPPIDLGG